MTSPHSGDNKRKHSENRRHTTGDFLHRKKNKLAELFEKKHDEVAEATSSSSSDKKNSVDIVIEEQTKFFAGLEKEEKEH